METNKLTKTISGKPKALALMASRLQVDENKMLDTLKATVFAKASNEELLALVVVANQYDLNPFLKELYAFPAKGGGIVPIVSVDGWNKMLLRQESFDGIEFAFDDKEDGTPHCCTATIYVKGRNHPVKITEYFDECHRNTDPWNNMPRRMLRNRTLCQAARVAFGFAGVYDPDEAIDVQAVEMPAKPLTTNKTDTETPAGQDPEKPKGRLPQQELESVVLEGGFTFDQFRAWATATEALKDADSMAGFDEVPKEEATRLLRAKSGLLMGLKGGANL
jgi:phage recombination protein Bet